MKKLFIILFAFIITSSLFASDNTMNFSLVLSAKNEDIKSIKNLDEEVEIIEAINNYNYSNFEENIYDYIYNLLNSFFLDLPVNEELKNFKISNLELITNNKNYKEIEENLTSYSSNLDENEIDKNKIILENEVDNNVDTVFPTFSKTDNSILNSILLNSKDDIIIKSVINKYDSIGIFNISIDKISSYNKLKIEYITKEKRTVIYNKIIIDNLISNLEQDLLLTFLNFFNNDYSIINLKHSQNIFSLSLIESISKERLEKSDNLNNVKIRMNDINEIDIKNDYIFLEKGTHYFQIFNNNTTDIMKIDLNEDIFDLKYESDTIFLENINLISEIGTLDYYINGNYYINSNSVLLENIELPFFIETKKEGYTSTHFLINEKINELSIDLRPSFIDDSNNIEKAQDDFYSSLLSYVLLSFTTLSINNINDAIGNSEYNDAIDVLSTSFTIFSSINIANKLISYIKLATK